MKTKNKNMNVVDQMRVSRGRYFGLTLNDGTVYCARFVKETPSYVMVFDRNTNETRKILKERCMGFRMGDVLI